MPRGSRPNFVFLIADDPAERGALARLRDELRTWRARVDDPVVW